MAVYTHVDAESLRDHLAHYDVGEPIAFKGIAEGVENSNYYLQTTKDRFILTLYERRASAKDLPFFLDLMRHLAKKGIKSPLPVKNDKGEYLQELKGKNSCLITFLDGVSVDFPIHTHTSEVGRAMARMHLAVEDFEQTRENDLSLEGWRGLITATADRLDEISDGLRVLVEDEISAMEDSWPSDLPTGVIHADLFPDNVLFTENTLSGLIDFYFAATDFFAYDIAVSINAWCFDAESNFSPMHAKALIEQYDSIRGLSPAEIEALPILCRGAALRFLLTRAYDWLNPVKGAVVRTKNPRDFAKRLEFHRSVKDASAYVF